MDNNKGKIKEILVAGFAVFAVFFGAGNLIFPPALAVMSGDKWFPAFLGFFVMDVVIAVLGLFVMIRYNGAISCLGERLGKKVNIILILLIVLCTGPLVAIPRTGTVTFSMAIKPLFKIFDDQPIALGIFSLVYFAIVLLFSIRPGKVIDIVGKYMTPVLLAGLIATIVVGIITGTLSSAETLVDNPIKEGVVNGYQTVDGLAAILFAGVLVKAARDKRPDNKKQADRQTYKAGLLAGILLFVIYIGLCYIGRLWGVPFSDYFMSGTIDQAGLLTLIIGCIMGEFGIYMISIITIFACLTTAIGLTTASAEIISNLFSKKISYKLLVILICILGFILSNVGLTQILMFANPILNLIYPVVITLIVLGLLSRWIPGRLPFILGTIAAFGTSILVYLCDTWELNCFSFIHCLPLNTMGLNFVVPTLAAVLVGIIIDVILRKRGKKSE